MNEPTVGLSWEEHRAFGAELFGIRQQLAALTLRLADAYGIDARATHHAERADRAVDELRHELDALLFREHQDRSREDLTRVYYRDSDSPAPHNASDPLPFE